MTVLHFYHPQDLPKTSQILLCSPRGGLDLLTGVWVSAHPHFLSNAYIFYTITVFSDLAILSAQGVILAAHGAMLAAQGAILAAQGAILATQGAILAAEGATL